MAWLSFEILAASRAASGGASWWFIVLTALVALAVGWFGRQATLGSARIAANVESEKLSHERDKYDAERRDAARRDFCAAQEEMTPVCLRDAEPAVRAASADKARRSLLSIRWTMGGSVGGPTLDELLGHLTAPVTDDKLDRAAVLWPHVEKTIVQDATNKAAR